MIILGHFDNFSCWQFGDESSAHKEGIRTMIDEIEYLSKGDLDKGHIQVVVAVVVVLATVISYTGSCCCCCCIGYSDIIYR